jgi:Flp pilus assembly pilin Flp
MTTTQRTNAVHSSSMTKRLLRDQRGAGLVEYAMLAGLVAIASFAAFRAFGTSVTAAVTGQTATIGSIPTQ